MDGTRILRGCRRAALALGVVLARFAWGSTYSYDRIGHQSGAQSYGAWAYLNPPSKPSYNPATSSLSERDEAHENWMKDIELAREKGSVAEFAMHRIPAYHAKVLTAMGNGDYGRVQALDQEISDFVEKNREELRPWANLQRSGPQGVALSVRVRQILDGSYKDAWALAPTSQGGQAQTLRQFLIEWSAEARASRLTSFARRHGLNMGLARAIADEGDALHPLFANDKRIYAEIDTTPGITLADDERVRMVSDWIRTKWSLAHDREVVSAFAGKDGSLDVQEFTKFMSSWENNLSRTKNGGIGIIKDAIASYKDLKDSEGSADPTVFVQDFARFQGGLTRTVTTVNDKGVVTSQQPSPVSMAQTMGLANAALKVGRKLGLSSRQILGNEDLARLLADQCAEVQRFRDFGFKIYSFDKTLDDNMAETAFARIGVSGAVNKLSFYRDGMYALDRAVMSDHEYVLDPCSAKVMYRTRAVQNAKLDSLEKRIRKALAAALLPQRRLGESWQTTVDRVMLNGDGRDVVKDAVRKSLAEVICNETVKEAIADAYLGNLEVRPDRGRLNAVYVLRELARPEADDHARHIQSDHIPENAAVRMEASRLLQTYGAKNVPVRQLRW